MKVVGIDISGRDVIIVALHKDGDKILNITGNHKRLRMEDDDDSHNVKLFKDTLHATLDNLEPEVIVIKYRNPSGRGDYAPSPVSFKVEGLIQIYDGVKICFTKPQTVSAYYKKHTLDILPDFVYQEDAFKMAHHYIKTVK